MRMNLGRALNTISCVLQQPMRFNLQAKLRLLAILGACEASWDVGDGQYESVCPLV